MSKRTHKAPSQTQYHSSSTSMPGSLTEQINQSSDQSQHPKTSNNCDPRSDYLQAQKHPWRIELEIDDNRQDELTICRAIVPNIKLGLYPFKNMKLTRADVEWLLATHENGRGPVDWSDESQRDREGLDLRGADFRGVNLQGLPLARTLGGLSSLFSVTDEQRDIAAVYLEEANLSAAHLEGASLGNAHLEGAILSAAHLEGASLYKAHLGRADLSTAHLEGASLYEAHLEGATLNWAHMERSALNWAHLEGANLGEVHLEEANLRAAHLEGATLYEAHLEGATLYEAHLEGATLYEANLEGASLSTAHLEGASLYEAHLEGTDLSAAHLETSCLIRAHLEGADLSAVHLEEADLGKAHLEGTTLCKAHLEGADLYEAHMEGKSTPADLSNRMQQWNEHFPVILPPADMRGAFLDDSTHLEKVSLGEGKYGFVSLTDVHWEGVNLAVVDWSQVKMLGDERRARQQKHLDGYQEAVRANRQLSTVLREQGLNEGAAHFAYRAQKIQQEILWRQAELESLSKLWQKVQKLWIWVLSTKPWQKVQKLWIWAKKFGAYAFSKLLDVLAGYGYKPGRTFFIYLVMILGFATFYHIFGHLSPLKALVFSLASFHGRGFFPNGIRLDDPITVLAAVEAVVGLLIEISFIATFTQRFFGK